LDTLRRPFSTTWPIMSLVDDKKYEDTVAGVAEAKRLHGCLVSDAELAQPLDVASSAQRDLLARKMAVDPRFKSVHDAVHFGRALSCASDALTLSKGLALSRQPAVVEFYNSDEWRAAADARFNPAAPVRKGMCTFCPDKPAAVLLSRAPGDTSSTRFSDHASLAHRSLALRMGEQRRSASS